MLAQTITCNGIHLYKESQTKLSQKQQHTIFKGAKLCCTQYRKKTSNVEYQKLHKYMLVPLKLFSFLLLSILRTCSREKRRKRRVLLLLVVKSLFLMEILCFFCIRNIIKMKLFCFLQSIDLHRKVYSKQIVMG